MRKPLVTVLFILLLVVVAALVVLVLQGTGRIHLCSTPAPTPTPTATPTLIPTATPQPVIQWNEAKYHIGEVLTVCGTVVDTHFASTTSGHPTFLNLGRPYGDPDRFTVVIWDDCRSNFPFLPEGYYYGNTIAVTGLIQLYDGIAEIVVCYPSDIGAP